MNLRNILAVISVLVCYYLITGFGIDYYLDGAHEIPLVSFLVDSGAALITISLCLKFARQDGFDLGKIIFNNLKRNKTYIWVIAGLLLVYAYSLIEIGIFELFGIENDISDWQASGYDIKSSFDGLLLVLVFGFIAPVSEEILDRGFIYSTFRKKYSIILSAILSSLIFAAMHIHPVAMPFAFVFGLVAVLVYEKTGTLAAPMMMHIIVNTVAAVFYLLDLS